MTELSLVMAGMQTGSSIGKRTGTMEAKGPKQETTRLIDYTKHRANGLGSRSMSSSTFALANGVDGKPEGLRHSSHSLTTLSTRESTMPANGKNVDFSSARLTQLAKKKTEIISFCLKKSTSSNTLSGLGGSSGGRLRKSSSNPQLHMEEGASGFRRVARGKCSGLPKRQSKSLEASAKEAIRAAVAAALSARVNGTSGDDVPTITAPWMQTPKPQLPGAMTLAGRRQGRYSLPHLDDSVSSITSHMSISNRRGSLPMIENISIHSLLGKAPPINSHAPKRGTICITPLGGASLHSSHSNPTRLSSKASCRLLKSNSSGNLSVNGNQSLEESDTSSVFSSQSRSQSSRIRRGSSCRLFGTTNHYLTRQKQSSFTSLMDKDNALFQLLPTKYQG